MRGRVDERSPAPYRVVIILRILGIGVLGLIGGALLGLFVQDLLATAFLGRGNLPAALTVVFIHLIPLTSIVTGVAVVVIDRRVAARRTEGDCRDD